MDFIQKAVMILVPMILSLTVHEYSHALAAKLLGDDTAQRLGRLTLNPMAHIDIFGTILLPLFSIGTGMPFLGWAKPVPTDPRRYQKVSRKTGYLLVSIAGPISNFIFGILAITILKILIVNGMITSGNSMLLKILQMFIFMNIGLGFFNLLPIPPLDGSKILQWFLSEEMARKLEENSMIFFGVLIILVFTGAIDYLVKPIFWIVKALFTLYGIQ